LSSPKKRTAYGKTLAALILVFLIMQWSVSSSGTVSHPGDLELLADVNNLPLSAESLSQAPQGASTQSTPRPKKFPASKLAPFPFAKEIALAAEANGIDALLLTAVVKAESRFDAAAISPKGALGLMQIKPGQLEENPELLLDPAHNLQRGAAYLREMLDLFGGDLRLALAAYNAGPGAVRRFGGPPPYAETTSYVARVLSSYVELHRNYAASKASSHSGDQS